MSCTCRPCWLGKAWLWNTSNLWTVLPRVVATPDLWIIQCWWASTVQCRYPPVRSELTSLGKPPGRCPSFNAHGMCNTKIDFSFQPSVCMILAWWLCMWSIDRRPQVDLHAIHDGVLSEAHARYNYFHGNFTVRACLVGLSSYMWQNINNAYMIAHSDIQVRDRVHFFT